MPYEFTSEEFTRFGEDIIKAGGDQATLTALITDMSDTVTKAVIQSVQDAEKVEKIEAENERLRKSNMSLFLRVGDQNAKSDPIKAEVEDEKEVVSTKSYMSSYFDKLDEEETKSGKKH